MSRDYFLLCICCSTNLQTLVASKATEYVNSAVCRLTDHLAVEFLASAPSPQPALCHVQAHISQQDPADSPGCSAQQNPPHHEGERVQTAAFDAAEASSEDPENMQEMA